MRLRFEGEGLVFDINISLRAILAMLYAEGRTEFRISPEIMLTGPWASLFIRGRRDEETGGYILSISGPVIKRLPAIVSDGEYEIVEEPTLLPQPPKLLSDGSHD